MSKIKTYEELNKHKQDTLNTLNEYLSNLINSKNDASQSKADKILYWLQTYAKFLDYEKDFNPSRRCRYKRGQVVKADFGFRIGSEYGGLHYSIVMDNNNSIHSPVVTVIPLTSVKPGFTKDRLKKGQVYLGEEIYTKLSDKASSMQNKFFIEIRDLTSTINELSHKEATLSKESRQLALDTCRQRLRELQLKAGLIAKISNEIKRMKHGSIAITNQIVTISKIRISDPKASGNVLSGVRLSSESLDLLDSEIEKLYLHQKL